MDEQKRITLPQLHIMQAHAVYIEKSSDRWMLILCVLSLLSVVNGCGTKSSSRA
jgi:hypothetical protein